MSPNQSRRDMYRSGPQGKGADWFGPHYGEKMGQECRTLSRWVYGGSGLHDAAGKLLFRISNRWRTDGFGPHVRAVESIKFLLRPQSIWKKMALSIVVTIRFQLTGEILWKCDPGIHWATCVSRREQYSGPELPRRDIIFHIYSLVNDQVTIARQGLNI